MWYGRANSTGSSWWGDSRCPVPREKLMRALAGPGAVQVSTRAVWSRPTECLLFQDTLELTWPRSIVGCAVIRLRYNRSRGGRLRHKAISSATRLPLKQQNTRDTATPMPCLGLSPSHSKEESSGCGCVHSSTTAKVGLRVLSRVSFMTRLPRAAIPRDDVHKPS